MLRGSFQCRKTLTHRLRNPRYRRRQVSSTTSSPRTFLSSPRSRRTIVWIGGAVLVIGVFIFFDRGPTAPRVSRGPAAARRVARTFLETAVARKNLGVAYDITGPDLKAGLSRAQWITGNNPVTYYPANNLKTVALKVKSSTKNRLWLEIGLVSKRRSDVPGSVRPLFVQMEVVRIRGKWLVNYFWPNFGPGPHISGGSIAK